MSSTSTEGPSAKTTVTSAALLAVLVAGTIPTPTAVTAQEGTYPRFVAPEASSEWIRGMGSADLMNSLAAEFVPLPGQPKFTSQPGQPTFGSCLVFVASLEGEISHLGRSPEDVELTLGMSAAEFCEGAERVARGEGDGTLLPGDMFFPGDAWVPEGFVFTSDMFAGGRIHGRGLVDELIRTASRSRDEVVRIIGERWAERRGGAGAEVPAWAFIVTFVPAEADQEFATAASAILLDGKRPWE